MASAIIVNEAAPNKLNFTGISEYVHHFVNVVSFVQHDHTSSFLLTCYDYVISISKFTNSFYMLSSQREFFLVLLYIGIIIRLYFNRQLRNRAQMSCIQNTTLLEVRYLIHTGC